MVNYNEYKKQYDKAHYSEIKIRIPKDKKPIIDTLVETTHKSINRIFVEAVEKVHNVDLTIVESKLKQPE